MLYQSRRKTVPFFRKHDHARRPPVAYPVVDFEENAISAEMLAQLLALQRDDGRFDAPGDSLASQLAWKEAVDSCESLRKKFPPTDERAFDEAFRLVLDAVRCLESWRSLKPNSALGAELERIVKQLHDQAWAIRSLDRVGVFEQIAATLAAVWLLENKFGDLQRLKPVGLQSGWRRARDRAVTYIAGVLAIPTEDAGNLLQRWLSS